jgi:hypothetical protein
LQLANRDAHSACAEIAEAEDPAGGGAQTAFDNPFTRPSRAVWDWGCRFVPPSSCVTNASRGGKFERQLPLYTNEFVFSGRQPDLLSLAWPSISRQSPSDQNRAPEPIYYCATGVEMPAFEPARE